MPKVERVLVDRRGKGGVDDRFDAALAAGNGRNLLQIGHAQVGVGGAFAEDEAGVGLHGGFHRVVIPHRHLAALDAQPLEEGLAKLAGFAVAVVGKDDVAAGGQHGEEDVGNGRHPRRKEQRVVLARHASRAVSRFSTACTVGLP
jgi:hypothetical protein